MRLRRACPDAEGLLEGLLEGSQLQGERLSPSVSNSRAPDGGGHAYSRGPRGDLAAGTDVRGGHLGVHAGQRGPPRSGHPST